MNLLKPLMLLGIVFGAIPIIIHFISKSRYRIESFGAMMFLESSIKIRARRIKFQQLLLLLLRVLFFAVLAFALARPVRPPRYGGQSNQPTTNVLIFDGSFSTHHGEGPDNTFSRLRDTALKIVDSMKNYDNMLIIRAGEKPRLLFPKPSFDKIFLRKKIQKLNPGYESMDIIRALEKTFWSLENSTLPMHRIFLLTDGQRTGWKIKNKSSWRRLANHRNLLQIKPAIYCYEQHISDISDNLAPVNIFPRSPVIDTFRPTKFTVELANFTTEKKDVTVEFSIDGEPVSSKNILLPPGRTATHFDYLFETSGSHYVSAKVSGDDLEVDNTLYHAVHVMKRIPVLIIEGISSENPWMSGGALLKMTLEASGEINDEGLFDVTMKNQLDIDMLDLTFLNKFKTIVLADVTSLSEYFRFNLQQFTEHGGGLLICLGRNTIVSDINKMNQPGGVMPAKLLKPIISKTDYFHPMFPAGKGNFILDIFDLKRSRLLSNVKVKKYWNCVPDKDSITLAYFGDSPFLVYKNMGEGQVILWTTSVNQDWNNFPVTRDFLPLIQNLVISLSASIQPPVNLAPGDILHFSTERPVTGKESKTSIQPNDETGKKKTCILTTPNGKKHKLPLEEKNDELTAQWKETYTPGLYTVEAPSLKTRYFTVAPNTDESDLRLLSDSEKKKVEDLKIVFVDNHIDLEHKIKQETGVREWWQSIIFLTIFLLCAELFLSWRFSS